MGWIPKTSPMGGDSNSFVNDMAASDDGSVFVAVGAFDPGGAGDLIMFSTDQGRTWTAASSYSWDDSGSYNEFYVSWAEDLGVFVAVGYTQADGAVVITSPDGDTWTDVWVNAAQYAPRKPMWLPWVPILSIPGTDLAPVTDVGFVLTSATGTLGSFTINAGTMPMFRPGSGGAVADALSLAITVGQGTEPAQGPMASTSDGVNYTLVASPLDDATFSRADYIAWGADSGVFVVNGRQGSVSKTVKSTNGVAFTDVTPPDEVGSGHTGGPVAELGNGTIFTSYGCCWGYLSADGAVTWDTVPITAFENGAIQVIVPSGAVGAVIGGTLQNDPAFDVVARGFTVVPEAAAAADHVRWKILIADRDGTGITDYSKLASGRYVTPLLNRPLQAGGTVPSDNPLVWTPFPDPTSDPYLAEGTRLAWWFRRESDEQPYYTVRAATLIELVEDAAQQDDATSAFTGWDPWQYLMSLPVLNADGELPGEKGLSFTATQPGVICATLLKLVIDTGVHTYIDAGATYTGTGFWAGEIETSVPVDINFARATTVGQAWQQITDLGYGDIILNPIYDPLNRPNYLVEFNFFAQAGQIRDEQRFAWNMPGRSLVGINRQQDGTVRANKVQAYAGIAGVNGEFLHDDATSVAKYGEYWGIQTYPAALNSATVEPLAQQQLSLRSYGRRTVSIKPAPERSPEPWVDYQLGDRVPVWASAQKFRQLLAQNTTDDPTGEETQYQRIYGWRTDIADDSVETVTPFVSQEGQTP